MTKLNGADHFKALDDLSRMAEVVVDKRFGQRSNAKKNRRNRHVENQFLRNAVDNHLQPEANMPDAD
jgi:hypothetical protein